MGDDPLDRIRARIAHCRQLAAHVNEPKTAAVLLQMADEAEADLKQLLAERDEPRVNQIPSAPE